MSDRLTQTLLRPIAVSCDVIITEARKYESKAECEIWTRTAIRGKQIWKTVHEDRYKAAVALAEMVGFELENG